MTTPQEFQGLTLVSFSDLVVVRRASAGSRAQA